MELGETILAVGTSGPVRASGRITLGLFQSGLHARPRRQEGGSHPGLHLGLDRDPGLTAARVNRGLAHLEIKAYGPALADFDRATLGAGGVAVQAGRGIALEASGRHNESDAAFREAFRQAGTGPDPARIRLLWTHGFAVAARRPEEARGSFDRCSGSIPAIPSPLWPRVLAMEGGQLDLALGYFDRGPRRTRASPRPAALAVIQARRGDWERASLDINWCLEREPTSGETVSRRLRGRPGGGRLVRSPESRPGHRAPAAGDRPRLGARGPG
ncbi:MAG: hypothetical protein WKF75_06305 [Singulisphaera sp.]